MYACQVLAKSSRSIRTRGAGDYAIGFTGTLNGRDFATHGTVQVNNCILIY